MTGIYEQLEAIADGQWDTPAWWRLVDRTGDRIYRLAELLTTSRNLEAKDWLKLCGILNDLKTVGVSPAQRRWLVIYCAGNLPEILRLEDRIVSERTLTSPFMS